MSEIILDRAVLRGEETDAVSPMQPVELGDGTGDFTGGTRRVAFEAGYRDGLAAGLADAAAERERARVALENALTALEFATEEMRARYASAVGELEDVTTSLACELVEALLGRELQLVMYPGREAIARALRLAPDSEPVTVRLNPGDHTLIGEHAHVEREFGREINILADRGVGPGGCILEIGPLRVDARLEPAIERVRAALGVGVPSAAPEARSTRPVDHTPAPVVAQVHDEIVVPADLGSVLDGSVLEDDVVVVRVGDA